MWMSIVAYSSSISSQHYYPPAFHFTDNTLTPQSWPTLLPLLLDRFASLLLFELNLILTVCPWPFINEVIIEMASLLAS